MNCDWFPWFPHDFRRDTYHLSLEEDGAYRRLIDEYMITRKPLPNDTAALARILGVPKADWDRIAPGVIRFFRVRNSLLWHKRCEEELRAQNSRHNRNRERAKKAAIAKHNKNKNLHATSMLAESAPCLVLSSLPLSVSSSAKNGESAIGDAARARSNGRASDWPAEAWEQFWATFPNKVGKKDAQKAFDRVRKSATAPAWAGFMAGLSRYVGKTDDRPWCNPATWLNQGRWDDQPAVAPAAKQNSGYVPGEIAAREAEARRQREEARKRSS